MGPNYTTGSVEVHELEKWYDIERLGPQLVAKHDRDVPISTSYLFEVRESIPLPKRIAGCFIS